MLGEGAFFSLFAEFLRAAFRPWRLVFESMPFFLLANCTQGLFEAQQLE